MPLVRFADETYPNDDCARFFSEFTEEEAGEAALTAKIHKAIAVIQLKLEGQLAHRRPEFHREKRISLDKIDYEAGKVEIDGRVYVLADKNFPIVNPDSPYELTAEERGAAKSSKRRFAGVKNCSVMWIFSIRTAVCTESITEICSITAVFPWRKTGKFRSAELAGKNVREKRYTIC